MSERYAIIVDGTAGVPADLARELSLYVLPLHVTFGADSYTAGVDLTDAEFYARLRDGKSPPPTTSQPSIGEVREILERALAEGNPKTLVLTVATELSGTFSVMSSTAQQIIGAQIEVVDMRGLAGQIALVATACARLRRDGGSFDDAVALAKRRAGKVHLLAAIDTLDQLRRSGRASSMQALFGSLLSIKPILEVKEGRLDAIERVRTREKAMARLKELIEARVAPGSRVHFCALHTNDPERARVFGEWAQERFHCVEYWANEVGAVVAAHAGPGVVGACFYEA